jgi:hypothetical protein
VLLLLLLLLLSICVSLLIIILLLQLLTYLRNKLLQHNALVQLPEDTDTTATSNKVAATGSDNEDNADADDNVDVNDLIDSFIAEKTHEEVLIDSYLAAHTTISEEERYNYLNMINVFRKLK